MRGLGPRRRWFESNLPDHFNKGRTEVRVSVFWIWVVSSVAATISLIVLGVVITFGGDYVGIHSEGSVATGVPFMVFGTVALVSSVLYFIHVVDVQNEWQELCRDEIRGSNVGV